MTDSPWTGDACSLVDAFRRGDRSPVEELDATLAAIETSRLNAFAFLDVEGARSAAATADLTKPFGGVPTGIKELEPVRGWPFSEASIVFEHRIADRTSHHVERLVARGGVVPVGATTASEFGGLNVSVTRLHGVTHNPWRHGRTVGGSSSGSAAAVAGGLVSLATGGDGGGSIRIPAGYTGLLGMKGTFGRIPRSPHAYTRPNTVVVGNVSRSVRDAARYYDVCAGPHPADPSALPDAGPWEQGLGTHELKGRKVVVVPALGGAHLGDGVEAHLRDRADDLIRATGLVQVERRVEPPNLAAQWMMGNLATLMAELGDRWPDCAHDLTGEVEFGLRLSETFYNLHTAAAAEELRIQANEVMAAAFADVDFVIAATNPGPAFAADSVTSAPQSRIAEWAMTSAVAKWVFRLGLFGTRATSAMLPKVPPRLLAAASARFPDLVSMGALTIISNIYGNPAVSIPAGSVDGLPVGMQVLAAPPRGCAALRRRVGRRAASALAIGDTIGHRRCPTRGRAGRGVVHAVDEPRSHGCAHLWFTPSCRRRHGRPRVIDEMRLTSREPIRRPRRTMKTMQRARRRWAVMATVVVLVASACGSSGGSEATKRPAPTELRGMVSDPPPDVGTLEMPDVSNGGVAFPMKAQPGELLVVFFGYTKCPDICPGTMAGLRLARRKLGTDAAKVEVAFATVDPGRDTDQVMIDYLGHFFDDAHALRTEDPALLQTVADGFGVRYEIATNAKGEVEVGHTALAFAVDDQGHVVDAWPFGFDEGAITDDMRILLGTDRA